GERHRARRRRGRAHAEAARRARRPGRRAGGVHLRRIRRVSSPDCPPGKRRPAPLFVFHGPTAMPTPPLLTRLPPLLFVLLWSTGFIGAKFGLPYAEPLTFLSSRYVLVIALMSLLALAMRAPWPASPREALHIGVTGVLVQAL